MRIRLHKQFRQDFRYLRKKYPSLIADVDALANELKTNPTLGEPLGKNRYKIRLKIASKKTGKSGGGRVISLVELRNDEIWLLTIYDKSDIASINDAFLDDLTKKLEE